MARVVITEFMDGPAVARLRDGGHEVVYEPELVDDAQRLAQLARDCDALIVRNRTQVRGALLDALARCRVVGRLGVGLDNIDVQACEARGIRVVPATGANALSVAEYVVTAALVLLRGAFLSSAAVASGQWPRARLGTGREAAGKTLGLVGFGSIGQTTARLAQGLGLRVMATDPVLASDHPAYAELRVLPVSLEKLLAESDVVSLHVPLTDGTRGLFDANRIARMKPGAVLVNTSRGHIVDLAAVVDALRAQRLGGAAIDVFDDEPLLAGVVPADCPNLILTPHISGVSLESNERVSDLIAQRVLDLLREPGAADGTHRMG
ncbi:MAG: hydroxyacid dehydrogenase [Pseudomonadota bacterium]